jgi:hypothetical protein
VGRFYFHSFKFTKEITFATIKSVTYRTFIGQSDIKPMTELKLPETLYGVTTGQALEILGISRSTLGDFKECLNAERPTGWDYYKGQRGFTVQQLRILLTLKNLVRTLGRPQAQNKLHQALEEQKNG